MKLIKMKDGTLFAGLGLLLALLLPAAADSKNFSVQAISYSDAIRFTVQGQDAAQTRVRIYDLSGRELFDSGFVQTATVDWPLYGAEGYAVSNGVYLFIATLKGSQGQVTSRTGKIAVLKEASLGHVAPPLAPSSVDPLNGLPRGFIIADIQLVYRGPQLYADVTVENQSIYRAGYLELVCGGVIVHSVTVWINWGERSVVSFNIDGVCEVIAYDFSRVENDRRIVGPWPCPECPVEPPIKISPSSGKANRKSVRVKATLSNPTGTPKTVMSINAIGCTVRKVRPKPPLTLAPREDRKVRISLKCPAKGASWTLTVVTGP